MDRQELKLVARIAENLPLMSSDTMQGWINNPKGLKEFLAGMNPTVATAPVVSNLTRWELNYEKFFGRKLDFSNVPIPASPQDVGPMRLIIVAKELMEWTSNHPLQGTQEALKKHFACWQYADDLDKSITMNDRDPRHHSYAVWVRDVIEADEEFANKSADKLKAESHTGITLLERQLLETDYFLETGKHLDVQNITLCTGSRDADGFVPFARWGVGFRFFEKGEHLDQQNVTLCSGSRDADGFVPDADWRVKFDVHWCGVSRRDPSLRSRRVWA